MYDVIIIGAGVSGCAVAYNLAKFQLKVLVVEQGADVAVATSRANSGIVHAGYDPEPRTLMASLNVAGNAMFPKLAKDLDIPFKTTGSLVVANIDQQEHLQTLLQRGRANGVPGLEIIGRDAILDKESNIGPDIHSALYAPTAGIVSPWGLTLALAEVAARNGVEFRFNIQVTGILTQDDEVKGIITDQGNILSKTIVNAAGVRADLLARMAGAERYTINPRKGQYLLLDRDLEGYVNHVVFPVPTQKGKGILVLPTVEGNLLAGPTAEDIQDREDISTTPEGITEIRKGSLGMFPELPLRAITSFAGLRAVADTGDFVIRSSAKIRGWFDVGGIQSPGLTAAPAIGEKVASMVISMLKPQGKEFVAQRKVLRPRDFPLEMRQQWIEGNPGFGRIVCRCEGVSEGEIVESLRGPIPATTLDGVKQRTRAGGGRCQGGFCQPRLIAIMAREMGVSPLDITKNGPGSNMLATTMTKGGKV